MDIQVFTGQAAVKKFFSRLMKSRTYSVEFGKPEDMKEFLRERTSPVFIYIDSSAYTADTLKKAVNTLSMYDIVRFGIIDKKRSVEDIADLFHRGASDYISGPFMQEPMQTKRMNGVIEYWPFSDEDWDIPADTAASDRWTIAPGGWKEIKSGREYTFYLLYIELDMIDEWKSKSGKEHIGNLQNTFRKHLEKYFTALGGKIWMWMNQGGILLFPFDGKSCDPVLTCLRFVLNKTIISIEEFGYNTTITYTMALHLGNAVYENRGETGDLISSTVNFLFHIAKQFAEPGNFYITEPVMPYLHNGLKELFEPRGNFEKVNISAMKLPKD